MTLAWKESADPQAETTRRIYGALSRPLPIPPRGGFAAILRAEIPTFCYSG